MTTPKRWRFDLITAYGPAQGRLLPDDDGDLVYYADHLDAAGALLRQVYRARQRIAALEAQVALLGAGRITLVEQDEPQDEADWGEVSSVPLEYRDRVAVDMTMRQLFDAAMLWIGKEYPELSGTRRDCALNIQVKRETGRITRITALLGPLAIPKGDLS